MSRLRCGRFADEAVDARTQFEERAKR